MLKITVLTDNLPHPSDARLVPEHGLSMFIEGGNWRLLYDMGLSGTFLHNAEILGTDLSQATMAIVSHGHRDHSGGLPFLLQRYPHLRVCLSKAIIGSRFFTSRHAGKRDLSTDAECLTRHAGQLDLLDDSRWLHPGLALVRCHTRHFPSPVGNCFLTVSRKEEEEQPDTFDHELSLAIVTDSGLVVVSACSHCGALNIIDACRKFTGEERLAAFIGGLHFVDCRQAPDETARFAQTWNRLYPDALLYTGHCTSDRAKTELARHIGPLHFFHTGGRILL